MQEKGIIMLNLYEELFLLALDDDNGNLFSFAKKPIAYGIAGAILSELVFHDKIQIGEKHRLVLKDSDPTGDEVLDEAIHEIKQSEKLHRPSYWISQFNLKKKKIREQLAVLLVSKGILHQEDKRLFWIYAEDEVDSAMPPLKYNLKETLRSKILSKEPHDARSLALLKLISTSGLLDLIFTHDEHSLATRSINEKLIRAALEKPELQTIEEIGQAVITCIEDELD